MMALRDGLVGAWCPSLGTSAGLLLDRSGRNNHGTLTNMDPATDWVASGGAGALDFDGINDQVIIGKDVGSTTSVSFSAWLFCRSTSRMVIATSGPNFSVPSFFVGVTAAQKIEVYRSSGFSSSNGSFSLNKWSHITVTSDAVTTQFFINGVLDRAVTQIGANAQQTQFVIGNGATGAINAQIDDIAVWNRPLTNVEVLQLYTQGRGGWLRQSRRRTYGFVAAGFKAYWARQRAGIIGGGVR